MKKKLILSFIIIIIALIITLGKNVYAVELPKEGFIIEESKKINGFKIDSQIDFLDIKNQPIDNKIEINDTNIVKEEQNLITRFLPTDSNDEIKYVVPNRKYN